jgi:hypothetical protein
MIKANLGDSSEKSLRITECRSETRKAAQAHSV